MSDLKQAAEDLVNADMALHTGATVYGKDNRPIMERWTGNLDQIEVMVKILRERHK